MRLSDGPTVFAHACKMGLEGIVSKRKDSAYRSGRSPDWPQNEKPGGVGGEARGRRGLGKEGMALILRLCFPVIRRMAR
jgi:hypothetical protein